MDKLKILALGLLLCLPVFGQQKFFVVYSKTTGRVRSFIVPQFSYETVSPTTGKGEGVLGFPMSQYGNLSTLQTLVTKATGLTPANDQYAIVNNQGQVIGSIFADPQGCGDSIQGATLVASSVAGPGWTYSAGVFTPPPSVVKNKTATAAPQ